MDKRNGRPVVIPIREQIFEWIKEAILTNEFKPGEVIPIDGLAREFGVSATPIREALIRLENSGLLTLIPNKGAVVTDFSEEDIRHTWEMRKILEPYAAALTAELDIADELEAIEGKVRVILRGDYDLHAYIQTDSELHELLFAHVDNSLLRETIERIHQISIRMRYFAESISRNQQDVITAVCEEHLEILDALRRGDAEAARQAARRHIENSESRTLSSTTQK